MLVTTTLTSALVSLVAPPPAPVVRAALAAPAGLSFVSCFAFFTFLSSADDPVWDRVAAPIGPAQLLALVRVRVHSSVKPFDEPL